MIVDRKFLAAFYTTPSSAALLIGLAIVPERTPADNSWSKPDDVKALRIADFASWDHSRYVRRSKTTLVASHRPNPARFSTIRHFMLSMMWLYFASITPLSSLLYWTGRSA